jgi:excisionase family DNA binding protein
MAANLTTKQLAERWAVNEDTIRRWARLKRIRCIKLPGAKKRGNFRFDLKDVEEFEQLYALEPRK